MAASLRAALVSRGSLRLAIAIACVGLCARWLPGSSALAGLLFVDHGWVTESVAERIDDVAFVLLAVAGVSVLTRWLRFGLLFAGGFVLLLSVAEALRDPAWRDVILFEHAIRWVAPLALFVWLRPDGRTRRDMDAMYVFLLRLGVALTFAGHGVAALLSHPRFLDLLFAAHLRFFGEPLAQAAAETTLHAIGIVDLALAVAIVAVRSRAVAAWMAFWGLVTALSRVVHSGMDHWPEAALRALHCGAPLALVSAFALPRKAPPAVGGER